MRASKQIQAPTAEDRLAQLATAYRPLPFIPDEFVDEWGKPRPHWVKFLRSLGDLSDDEIAHRFAAADRHIHESGVSYRIYGDLSERTWPLSHVPLLIEADEWREIATGICQRVRLLEAILQDIYGEGRLVGSGALPATAITGSADYLHPLQGVRPPGGKYLYLYAADIGRGPDGRWWVLGDRTQAPSGAGYALANRLVLSRAFPGLYGDMNIERLAPFFQAFREGLIGMARRSDPRICLLTPGPFNETYFEQAYLARYLGFLLVEGGDLTMRDGEVHVRTIAGLKRADVLWRRVDSDFCDPLELNAQSRLGVPGLIDSLREGGVVVANALGSGVLEAPALMSFIPRLCRTVLGEELALPNIATWWCGQPHEREDVINYMDGMAITGAYGNPVLGRPARQPVVGMTLTPQEKERLAADIRRRGIDYVGQEVVNLSTTPVWEDGRLVPRPFVLRVYAACTPNGWKVMPGGFCRISDRADARAVSMGEGVQSADVWVIADKPVEMVTLLPDDDSVRIRRLMGNLPSRAADNLFWLGRYLERTEATLRLVRCLAGKLMDPDTRTINTGQTIDRVGALLVAWGAAPEELEGDAFLLVAQGLYGKEYGSVASLVGESRRAASFIRERLSPDTWRLINDLFSGLALEPAVPVTEADTFERADAALRTIAAIAGVSLENMNRGAGWRLLDMGRRVERGINTCRFSRHFTGPEAAADDFSVLLDLIDSQITYRTRYLMGAARHTVRDMAVLDPYNPRSVAFQIERLDEHLQNLPLLSDDGMLEEPRRRVVKLAAGVATAQAAHLGTDEIFEIEQSLLCLADAIATRYFLQGPHAARADKTSGLA